MGQDVTESLALYGGTPVCSADWPAWPQIGPRTLERVAASLASGRWAISGPAAGLRTADLALAEAFAEFVGVPYCVPVDHGSSALVAALTALGVGPGDEVIVPGLTWVACASAALRVGAIPVLADVDETTLCVDPAAVAAAITPRTAAILAVHLYSAMADMDRLRSIADIHGVALVEDAAQAHGALWHGRAAGSLGDIGTFSLQQGKLLTAGEGGLVTTSQPDHCRKIEKLRGDGRAYLRERVQPGRPDLGEHADVQGWNMHMSEVQATLALDGLERLPEQNARRALAAAALDRALDGIDGVEPVVTPQANDGRVFYHYVVLLDRDSFAGRPVSALCEALSAELSTWVHPIYSPLNVHPLLQPKQSGFARDPDWARRSDPRRFELPVAHRQAARAVAFHHPLLLAETHQIAAIAEALDKVRRLADKLPPQ